MDGIHPGLPAGFTSFSAAGVPEANGECCRAGILFDLVGVI